MNTQDREHLVRWGMLNALDYQFARFISRLSGTDDTSLFLAAAMVSHATGRGHVCCDLSGLAGKELPTGEATLSPLRFPGLDAWCESLRAHPVVGLPRTFCPLILDEKGRLYLYRYWKYENDLAAYVRKGCSETVEGFDPALLEDGLDRYFPPNGAERPDWQRIAAAVAVARKFCVISGGPGTGKTTTVARILALLVEQASGARLRIALAAPTGKAAARMEEAIGKAKGRLNAPPAVIEAIPEEASTLHRLLGTVPGSPYFRRHAANPLAVDVVIVDEASMVDLALMAKLVDALPGGARLILLGDKDQLASVEAGAVLGDICDTGTPRTGFPPFPKGDQGGFSPASSIVELRRSYRFGSKSGIGAVSLAVREGEGDEALSLLQDGHHQDVGWKDLPRPEALARALRSCVLEGFGAFLRALQGESLPDMLASFEGFRILCALRQGPYGVIQVNRLVEAILAEARLIQPGQWYRGRPVMITTNDYNLRLFNGDIGIILPETRSQAPEGERGGGSPGHGEPSLMAAYFPAPDGTVRKIPPARLPAHETVYAMTVHKSQGSEFDEVLLLLSDRESPVLTRELLYTGITRARARVAVWGREAVFRSAAATRVQRSSGLREAIWGLERTGSCY